MKKTLLAVVIPALFASAANAAVIYDKDGTTFDVYGRVQANYYGSSDSDADTEIDGTARLGWSGKMALNNTWSAIAKTDWDVAAENEDESKFKARHIYAGFDGAQYGKIIFGQTETAYYMGLIEKTDVAFETGGTANGVYGEYGISRQEGQIIYMNRWAGLFANASYQTSTNDVDNGFAGSIGYDFANGFGIAAGGQFVDYKQGSAKGDNVEDWAVAASYATGPYYFAAMYNENTLEDLGVKETIKGWEFFGNYSVDAWTFELGYNKAEDEDGNDAVEWTYLGAQYKFNSKLKAWTEYAIAGLSEADDGWTLGLQYNF
ncbi:MAG: porin [Cetobacterium sp.]